MAYDEQFAERIRRVLDGRPGVGEIKMFGGLCFTVNGNMACGVGKDGDLMIRVGADRHEELLGHADTREMDFTGRSLTGMLYVREDALGGEAGLRHWVTLAADYAGSLRHSRRRNRRPSKRPLRRPPRRGVANRHPAQVPSRPHRPQPRPAARQ